jgi:acyl carrier protein
MTDTAILAQITEILRDIFEDPALEVTPATTAKMVPGWDSMAQVKLLMAVEEAFGLHFSSREMDRLRNVGDLIEIVARHTGKSG